MRHQEKASLTENKFIFHLSLDSILLFHPDSLDFVYSCSLFVTLSHNTQLVSSYIQPCLKSHPWMFVVVVTSHLNFSSSPICSLMSEAHVSYSLRSTSTLLYIVALPRRLQLHLYSQAVTTHVVSQASERARFAIYDGQLLCSVILTCWYGWMDSSSISDFRGTRIVTRYIAFIYLVCCFYTGFLVIDGFDTLGMYVGCIIFSVLWIVC